MSFSPIGQTDVIATPANQSEAGTPAGKTECATSLPATSEIATWLATRLPSQANKAAVSRMQSHGVTVDIKYRTMFPEGGGVYDLAVGCTMRGGDQKAALADIEKFLTPAPIRQIEMWLAELSVLTAGKGREGLDAELLLTAYSSRLAQFPADVVKYVLTEKTWKWFPAWEELDRICRSKTSPRRMMAEALRNPVEPEEERRLATPDEKERIRELIAEKFPNVPQSWRDEAERQVAGGYQFSGEAAE